MNAHLNLHAHFGCRCCANVVCALEETGAPRVCPRCGASSWVHMPKDATLETVPDNQRAITYLIVRAFLRRKR